jgi:hypothetical protein
MNSIEKRSGGRPLKYHLEELNQRIDEYFSITPTDEQMITGLALHLGTTRQLLCEYAARNDGYGDTIKRAKARVEMAYEKNAPKSPILGIFKLKNMGWTDQQIIRHEGVFYQVVIDDPPHIVIDNEIEE